MRIWCKRNSFMVTTCSLNFENIEIVIAPIKVMGEVKKEIWIQEISHSCQIVGSIVKGWSSHLSRKKGCKWVESAQT